MQDVTIGENWVKNTWNSLTIFAASYKSVVISKYKGNLKKRTIDTNNMNKPQKPHVKWKKPDIKDMYYTIPLIRNFWKMI